MGFRKDFAWGVASSSYQNEGGAYADGKGLSVWDVFSHEEGRIGDGYTGDGACDQYHLLEQDLKIMEELAVNSYRFSISWPRVLPSGTGKINELGLDYYDRMVDGLLERNITPYITLFHWDLPYELYLKGGWLNRDIPEYFAEFTAAVVDRLSDRVNHWITQNEPQCYIGAALESGEHAPGLKLGKKELFQAAHHSLLSHGRAVQTIRARAKKVPEIGYAPASWWLWSPVTEKGEDIEACRAKTFCGEDNPIGGTAWWLDPVCLGKYPEDGWKKYEPCMPSLGSGDMKLISEPVDFLGMNIYQTYVGRSDKMGGCETVDREQGEPRTMSGWSVTPQAMYWGPKFYWERYGKKLYITENGVSGQDWISLDGCVHDPQRIDFTHRYLRQLRRAAEEGVDLGGYFHWTFMDNFEWSTGYQNRFGLVYVDFASQNRILKDSARWYRDMIRTNGENL